MAELTKNMTTSKDQANHSTNGTAISGGKAIHDSYKDRSSGDEEDETQSPKHQRLANEISINNGTEMEGATSKHDQRNGHVFSSATAAHPYRNVVDREKTCPMFVRMFCRMHGHHRLDEFSRDAQPLEDELVLYTWKDATLKELAGLIKEVHEDSRRRDAKFSFRQVYQEANRGSFLARDLGLVYNSRPTRDDRLRLDELRFTAGDFIDVAIHFGPRGIAPPEQIPIDPYHSNPPATNNRSRDNPLPHHQREHISPGDSGYAPNHHSSYQSHRPSSYHTNRRQ